MKILDYLIKENIPFHSLKYYKQAFTHSSYANEAQNKLEDYERLEFMGDAVLQLFVSEYLFKSYPDYPEGELTTLRSKLVREESLAKFARELRLEELIYLGVGEEKSGGRDRDSVLCDIFESFVGALYLDCGKKEVIKILHKTIFKHVDDVFHSEAITDYKTKLQELIQADDRRGVTYKLIAETGPANAPEFTINVTLDGMVLGTGKGTSKKKAEQQSAKDALLKMAKTKEKD
ncbi:ribonuclease III [Eggerthia catenaformis]|uniref:ribonuclease III n=1 Tax=Eggerthia catenaformis TaxID=31973 RepID=UPI00248D469B|nr:ribonuclease III [Eggerthia catenaformis]